MARSRRTISALLLLACILLPPVLAADSVPGTAPNVVPGTLEWWFEKTGWLGVTVVFVWRVLAWLAPRLDTLFVVHRDHLKALDLNMASIAKNDERQTILIGESTRMIEDIHYHTVPRVAADSKGT